MWWICCGTYIGMYKERLAGMVVRPLHRNKRDVNFHENKFKFYGRMGKVQGNVVFVVKRENLNALCQESMNIILRLFYYRMSVR